MFSCSLISQRVTADLEWCQLAHLPGLLRLGLSFLIVSTQRAFTWTANGKSLGHLKISAELQHLLHFRLSGSLPGWWCRCRNQSSAVWEWGGGSGASILGDSLCDETGWWWPPTYTTGTVSDHDLILCNGYLYYRQNLMTSTPVNQLTNRLINSSKHKQDKHIITNELKIPVYVTANVKLVLILNEARQASRAQWHHTFESN